VSGVVARLQERAGDGATRQLVGALFIGVFAITALIGARTHTPTVDEFVYLPAGYYHLRTGDLTLDPTNPPLLKMAMAVPLLAMYLELDTDPRWRDDRTGWGPWIFGTRFMDVNRAHYLEAFFIGRAVVLAFGVAGAVLVLARARALLSPLAALAALMLYCTMPPIIAHSSLATLDVGVMTLLFAGLVALERFASTKMARWAATTGLVFGLAITAKGVAALFLPLIPVLAAAQWSSWQRGDVGRVAGGLVWMAVAAWVAVLAVYGFSGFPLPAPVVDGLRFQIAASSAGEFPAFLLGAWSQAGWWYYYLVALLFKTPLPTLVLLVVGAGAVLRERLRGAGDLWMVLPPLLLLYFLSFHYGKFYGIRYLLPAFPFLVLLAGRGVDVLLRGRRSAAVAAVLLLWQLIASVLATPHHLAYFNELAWPGDRARRILLDSNLDWGQDLGRLKTYLDARGLSEICLGYFGHVDPELYGIAFTLPPTTPTPGLCAVSANFLAGYPYAVTYAGERILAVRPGAWSWFDRLDPVARVGRSIYVFDVTPDDVRRLATSEAR
jgi:hypothetical protein